jgi:hypothetical protein
MTHLHLICLRARVLVRGLLEPLALKHLWLYLRALLLCLRQPLRPDHISPLWFLPTAHLHLEHPDYAANPLLSLIQ